MLSRLKQKKRGLIDEIARLRREGSTLTWKSDGHKQQVLDLMNEPDDYSKVAKEVRALSIEATKVKDSIVNLLKFHGLLD